jgi:methionyl-tRNA synthetase
MAAGIALPKSVVANGWLLFEESKMSKSRGNVVRTETILDALGPLCPPVPIEGAISDPSSEAVILSRAKNPRISPEAPQPPTDAKDGSSSGLQPAVLTPKEAGALAPGLAVPTKAQQDLFASDILRYFLLREIPFGQDGSFSFDALITRYNADLANGYGNLVSRTLTMIEKYCDGQIPSCDYAYIGSLRATQFVDGIDRIGGDAAEASRFLDLLKAADESYAFSSTLELVQQLIKRVDLFLSETKPWKLDEEDDTALAERNRILYTAADAIRIITFQLHPYMPHTTSLVWKQLGFQSPIGETRDRSEAVKLQNLKWGGLAAGTKLGPLGPIFPRADKGLAQIMTDMENPTPVDKEPVDPAAVPHTPTSDPAAAPRTTTLPDPAAALPVGGSTALTTGPDPTKPSPVPADPSAPAPVEATPQITIDDFAKVELRVAQILVAERIPKADKLLRLEVDLGPDFPRRQILSGIAEWYAPEDLIGRRIVVITNLAPRKMRGLESHGMLLAASHGENGKPVLATFGEDIALGSRLK